MRSLVFTFQVGLKLFEQNMITELESSTVTLLFASVPVLETYMELVPSKSVFRGGLRVNHLPKRIAFG